MPTSQQTWREWSQLRLAQLQFHILEVGMGAASSGRSERESVSPVGGVYLNAWRLLTNPGENGPIEQHKEQSIGDPRFSAIDQSYLFSIRKDRSCGFFTLYLSDQMLDDLNYLFEYEQPDQANTHILDQVPEPRLKANFHVGTKNVCEFINLVYPALRQRIKDDEFEINNGDASSKYFSFVCDRNNLICTARDKSCGSQAYSRYLDSLSLMFDCFRDYDVFEGLCWTQLVRNRWLTHQRYMDMQAWAFERDLTTVDDAFDRCEAWYRQEYLKTSRTDLSVISDPQYSVWQTLPEWGSDAEYFWGVALPPEWDSNAQYFVWDTLAPERVSENLSVPTAGTLCNLIWDYDANLVDFMASDRLSGDLISRTPIAIQESLTGLLGLDFDTTGTSQCAESYPKLGVTNPSALAETGILDRRVRLSSNLEPENTRLDLEGIGINQDFKSKNPSGYRPSIPEEVDPTANDIPILETVHRNLRYILSNIQEIWAFDHTGFLSEVMSGPPSTPQSELQRQILFQEMNIFSDREAVWKRGIAVIKQAVKSNGTWQPDSFVDVLCLNIITGALLEAQNDGATHFRKLKDGFLNTLRYWRIFLQDVGWERAIYSRSVEKIWGVMLDPDVFEDVDPEANPLSDQNLELIKWLFSSLAGDIRKNAHSPTSLTGGTRLSQRGLKASPNIHDQQNHWGNATTFQSCDGRINESRKDRAGGQSSKEERNEVYPGMILCQALENGPKQVPLIIPDNRLPNRSPMIIETLFSLIGPTLLLLFMLIADLTGRQGPDISSLTTISNQSDILTPLETALAGINSFQSKLVQAQEKYATGEFESTLQLGTWLVVAFNSLQETSLATAMTNVVAKGVSKYHYLLSRIVTEVSATALFRNSGCACSGNIMGEFIAGSSSTGPGLPSRSSKLDTATTTKPHISKSADMMFGDDDVGCAPASATCSKSANYLSEFRAQEDFGFGPTENPSVGSPRQRLRSSLDTNGPNLMPWVSLEEIESGPKYPDQPRVMDLEDNDPISAALISMPESIAAQTVNLKTHEYLSGLSTVRTTFGTSKVTSAEYEQVGSAPSAPSAISNISTSLTRSTRPTTIATVSPEVEGAGVELPLRPSLKRRRGRGSSESNRFICADCGMRLKTKQYLDRHRMKVHGAVVNGKVAQVSVPCSNCGKSFSRDEYRVKHEAACQGPRTKKIKT